MTAGRGSGAPTNASPREPAGPGAPVEIRPPSLGRAIAGTLVVSATEALLIAWALGGLEALARHALALALLVVWFAGGLTLSILRPVRRHDPLEAPVREPRLLLFALFAIPFFTPALAALGERFGWGPLPGGAALRWAGVALSGAGFALRIAALARLRSRFSPLLVIQRGHVLETSGPYAWIRHPGYAGAWLATFGAVLAFGSAVGLAPAVAFLLILDRRTRREERLLERQFGSEFQEYRARTKRLLPGIY